MPNSESRTFGDNLLFQYTVVVPAYNEEERLAPTLDRILGHIEQKQWRAEIIVVDDGSADSTAEVASMYARAHPCLRLIRNSAHRGKGHAVRSGVMHAAGRVVLIMDADLPASMPATSVLFGKLSEGADVAIASRWLRPELQRHTQGFLRNSLSRCFNRLTHLLLGLKFEDTQCGVKAFTRDAAQLVFRFQRVSGWAFDTELLVIARELGLVVEEVPVVIQNDARSRLRPLFDSAAMFSDLLRIVFHQACGRYPSFSAPSFRLEPSRLHTGIRSYFQRRPVQVAFVLCLLAAATAQSGDTIGLRGLTHGGGTFAVSQNPKSPPQLREAHTSTPYLDQSFAAEEFDLASDHD